MQYSTVQYSTEQVQYRQDVFSQGELLGIWGDGDFARDKLRSVRYLTPRLDAMINEANIGC